jgi:8-oxo-dGTP diphosphatase
MRYGISAGTIVLQARRLLLVHHFRHGEFDFWVPPGGRLIGSESIYDCARRETFEETGLEVEPKKIVYIQEFVERDYHVCKFFILSRVIAGKISLSNRPAGEVLLIDARFLSQSEITEVDVKPDILKGQFWDDLSRGFLTVRYLGLEIIR